MRAVRTHGAHCACSPPTRDRENALQTFSPREIQSRVRAGASADQVADDTGWPLDKVLRYAEPLLAERSFIAEQALLVEVRRSGGGASLRQTAAAAVGVPADSDEIAWDARRREDGKWVVSATYAERTKVHTAEWTYDHVGRNVHPLDDNARSLMGVRALGDDQDDIAEALDLVTEPASEPAESRPRLVAVPDAKDEAAASDEPEDEPAPEQPVPAAKAPIASKPRPSIIEETPPAPAAPAKTAAPKPKARKGRAHVPSWDEILFGATRPDDQA